MSEPTAWPPGPPGARVRLRLGLVSGDGPDPDPLPDWSASAGTPVRLTPSYAGLLTYDVGGPDPIVMQLLTVEAVTDADGWLTTLDGRPVIIAATDDPLMSVTGWVWTAKVGAASVVFAAPSGGVVELAHFVGAPATDQTKQWVAQIPALIAAAEDLRAVIEAGGVDPDVLAQAIADYLAANPIEGVTPAQLATALADYVTTATLTATLTGYVTTDDARLTDARTPTAHTHPVAQISDSTATGRAVVTAADAPAARAVIGAGTSSLALGGTSSTAAAGDHLHDGRYAPIRTTPTVVAAATYTLAAGDESAGIRTTSATAVTTTVPSGLPVGYVCPILVDGAGMVTVVAGAGVTLAGGTPAVSRAEGSTMAVQIIAAGRAWIVGDLA